MRRLPPPRDFFPVHLEHELAGKFRTIIEKVSARTVQSIMRKVPTELRVDESLWEFLQKMRDLITLNLKQQEAENFGSLMVSYVDKKLARPLGKGTRPGIAVSTRGTLATDAAVQAFARKSVEMISGLQAEYFDEIARLVQESVTTGRVQSLETDLSKYSDTIANRAEFYAQDLVGDTFAEVSAKRQQDAGFPGYIWMTSLDARVRDEHAHLHGKFFTWAQTPPGLVKPGAKLPGSDYRCRCTAYPALGEQDQLSRDQREEDLSDMNKARMRQGLEAIV